MFAACEILEPYIGEFFDSADVALISVLPDRAALLEPWLADVLEVFNEARLKIPNLKYIQRGGREGRHTEAMGHLLAQLQYMQRSFPEMTW